MKINLLFHTDNDLKIEIIGEGHTFCNALQCMLLKDKDIEIAGYSLVEPITKKSTLYISTKKGKKPEDASFEAAKNLQKKLTEIEKAFLKVCKKIKE